MTTYADYTERDLYAELRNVQHSINIGEHKFGVAVLDVNKSVLEKQEWIIQNEINNRIMKRQQELKDKNDLELKKELDKLYLNIGKYVQTGNEDSFDAEAMRWQARAIEEELRERKKEQVANVQDKANLIPTFDELDLETLRKQQHMMQMWRDSHTMDYKQLTQFNKSFTELNKALMKKEQEQERVADSIERPDAKNKIGIKVVGVTADNGDLVTDDNRIIDFTDNAVRFEDNLAKMLEIYKKKNKDYGNSTHKTYEKYGYVSYLTRIDDKLNRLENLLKSGATPEVEESISDTLIDLANYFIIFKMELEDESKD
jgi:hypothetical protein